MPNPPTSAFIRRFILILATAAILAGCETAPKATDRLGSAIDHYHAQRFSQSHQDALAVVRTPSAPAADREQATYLAGLAAFRNGDRNEAELRLSAVTSTSDQRLYASAQALLGQIRLDQRRPAEAASHFEAASRGLAGEDARQARRYAAAAHQQAGNHVAARQWQESAGEHSSGFRSGFTLQVGAFSERNRADHAAAQAAEIASGHGLGPVNVRPSTDARGRPLYLVQFGYFPTRQAAAQARSSLGRLEYIVAPLGRG